MSLPPSELRLDWCSHEAARYAVERWYHRPEMPKSKLAKIGVWERGRFVGALIFGTGACQNLVRPYGLSSVEGCELVRIALGPHEGQVSRMLRVACLMIHREFPGLRMAVTFADPQAGHHGGIYQGAGWIYAGMTAASVEYLYQGRRWQGRAFRMSFGPGRHKELGAESVLGTAKHRYLFPFDPDMCERLRPFAKPFPKPAREAG
jgi:hypothetical protein